MLLPKAVRPEFIHTIGQGLRIELRDVADDRMVASFDDMKLARDWLRQRDYRHTPLGRNGLWLRND